MKTGKNEEKNGLKNFRKNVTWHFGGSQNNTIKTLLSHSHCLGSNASILQHDFNDKVHFSTNLAKKIIFFRFICGCIRQYYRIGWFVKQIIFVRRWKEILKIFMKSIDFVSLRLCFDFRLSFIENLKYTLTEIKLKQKS